MKQTREKYRHEFGKFHHWSIVCNQYLEAVIFKDYGRITIARSGKNLLEEMVDLEEVESTVSGIPDIMIVPQIDSAKQKVCFVSSLTEVLDALTKLGFEFDSEQQLYHSCPLKEEEEYLKKISNLGYLVKWYRRKD